MSLRERLRRAGDVFNVGNEKIGDEGALEIASSILEEVPRVDNRFLWPTCYTLLMCTVI